jgi:hypothetical protein
MQQCSNLHRPALGGLALAAMLFLGACATPPAIIDNPKDGDVVDLVVAQPFTVKLTDTSSGKSVWSMTATPSTALTDKGRRVVPGEGGALPLTIYEFVGASPGSQRLTFSHHKPDQAPGPDDVMTITVTVKS